MGKLTVEGEHIERLVLKSKYGENETIKEPNGVIELPIGEYSLMESHLEGEYISRTYTTKIRFTIAEEKPAVLKIGAPLEQKVEIRRQGRFLLMNYKLVGLAGESYIDNKRSKPVGFTIYKGDDKIISDKFQYG